MSTESTIETTNVDETLSKIQRVEFLRKESYELMSRVKTEFAQYKHHHEYPTEILTTLTTTYPYLYRYIPSVFYKILRHEIELPMLEYLFNIYVSMETAQRSMTEASEEFGQAAYNHFIAPVLNQSGTPSYK